MKSFMLSPEQVAQINQKDDLQKAEQAKARSRAWRFSLAYNESKEITFVDGDLADNGMLDIASWNEHSILLNNRWGNHFVCLDNVADDDGNLMTCPICERGDRPSLVSVMTVIVHTPYTAKKTGKVSVDMPQLFVAKRTTKAQLEAIARKRGGLAGVTMEISRSDDKMSARSGNIFTVLDQNPIEDLVEKYEWPEGNTKFKPLDYEFESNYMVESDLRGLLGNSLKDNNSENVAPSFGGSKSNGWANTF